MSIEGQKKLESYPREIGQMHEGPYKHIKIHEAVLNMNAIVSVLDELIRTVSGTVSPPAPEETKKSEPELPPTLLEVLSYSHERINEKTNEILDLVYRLREMLYK